MSGWYPESLEDYVDRRLQMLELEYSSLVDDMVALDNLFEHICS